MEVGDARFVSAARSMTSNPHWMQRAELVLAGEDVDEQVARVSVWDKRASTRKSGEKMTCLGAAVFPLARLESFRPTKLDLALEGGVRDGARVALVLELRDARRETRREEEKTKRAEAARARRAAATTPSPARREAEATTFGAVLRPRGTPFAASPRTARDVPPRAVHSESRVEEKPEERVFEETRFAASRSAADHPRDAPLPSPLPSPRGETEAEKPVRVRESVTSRARFETPSQPAGPRGGGDLSVSSGDDSNRAPRGDARARADSPPSPSPSPAHRRHHRLAPEVSFFAMTTPPASRAASANSRLKARARASTTPEAIPSEKRAPSSSRTSRVGGSVDAVGDETPATSFVSRETTREHEGRGAEGEDASPPVPETTRRLESPSAPSAARRVAEAETQTDSERERAETHYCATADPTLRFRTNDANDSEDVARTPPLPVRRLAVGSPVGSPVSIAGLAVRTRASASATEKEDAFVDKRADSEGAVASPPARPATPVPPLGHASPFGSFRPVDRRRGGSPARPPLRPRARGVSEREGKAGLEGARPKPLGVRRPGNRRSDFSVVGSSEKENDVFAAASDVRNLSQEKETVSKKTIRVPETNKTFAFLNRAFAIPPDDAYEQLVAAATTRAVVAVELDEVRRLGRRLARAEAALDAF